MSHRHLLRLAVALLLALLFPSLNAQQQTPLTTNLLTNPGAESGSIAGWTPTGPGAPTVDSGSFNGGINPHTGSFDFLGHDGASDSLAQTVSLLTQGITSTQLDSGTLYASLSFWEQGLNQGTPSDDAFVTLTFLDANNVALSTVNSGEVDAHDGAWQNFSSAYPIPAGTRSITYTMNFLRHAGSDLDGYIDDNSLILSTVTQTTLTPTITWPAPAPIVYGTPLSSIQLNASATGVSGAPLPGTFTYTPAAGTILPAGSQPLRVLFTPTDAADYTSVTAANSLAITQATPTLTFPTPAAISVGTALSATQLNASATGVNGQALPGTFTYTPAAGTILPAGSQTLRVLFTPTDAANYISAVATTTLTVTSSAPAATLSGPGTTPPGSQPSVSLILTNPFPTTLTATATLSFAASVTPAINDPALQFAAGGRTLTFTIPANSTAIPPILLQAGTVAGTITVSVTLATGPNSPAVTVQPAVIVVPAAVPVISTLTAARTSNQLSVAIHGFSNTREVTTATFHFVPIAGVTLDTPDITAAVTPLFSGWFASTQSAAFGSTFTYTQLFNVSDDPARIASVQVTLTNSVGTSNPQTAQ